MPIRNHPFPVTRGINRPMLWIRVTNPATKQAIIALAIVIRALTNACFLSRLLRDLGISSNLYLQSQYKQQVEQHMPIRIHPS